MHTPGVTLGCSLKLTEHISILNFHLSLQNASSQYRFTRKRYTIQSKDFKTLQCWTALQDKYGLSLDAIHLPAQTLEHGQDVLYLMRHIHILVQQYSYNLNAQVRILS
jgi:hypothetical protein